MVTAPTNTRVPSRLTDDDLHWFNEGTHRTLYEKLGAHATERDGVQGTSFGVWAPNARRVTLHTFGEQAMKAVLHPRGSSGIWEGFVEGIHPGTLYKYEIESRDRGYKVMKADPFAFHAETPPQTASVVWDLNYEWHDEEWLRYRAGRNALTAPQSVYEVHLGSWQRHDDEAQSFINYRDMAPRLIEYVGRLGFTHVELLPIMEHPFFGSWGYQTTGYFAPTSRFGTPQDFMWLVDQLHQAGIGVILDWVPSHFPNDEHGLAYFDGTHLFEHADPRQGFHPDWKSCVFNYGRNEVRSFLLSSARYWLDKYHIDGLRVDAVASMLYLDYSRKAGEWIPNKFGGRENLEAILFLRTLNESTYADFPGVQTIAEESTAWPMVSRPTFTGGLGFGMKWDMGWMHDTLHYMSQDAVFRKYHHHALTFRNVYAFTENFMLPLSHDEVVHGKGSLYGKMPGDHWQKLANLRLLYGYMFTTPGKKLLFMGDEFGQHREWNHDSSLDWDLLEDEGHEGLRRWVEDINRLYRGEPALHQFDCEPQGFEWLNCCDVEQSVISYLRKADEGRRAVVVCNFTPVPRHNYRLGVPSGGRWTEALNSDAELYGGSGMGNMGGADAVPTPCLGQPWTINVVLPPLATVVFVPE